MDDEYQMLCMMSLIGLCGLSQYTDGGAEELSAEECMYLLPVLFAFQEVVGEDNDTDDFRVDDTLY